MKIANSTALVTGASRGIGQHFVAELRKRGAKVYATARRPEDVPNAGAEVIGLDITDPSSIEAAVALAGDVDLLINNAADTRGGNLVTGSMDAIRSTMDTNFFGTLAMIRAFAPVLARNGGGAILNVLSATAWFTVDGNTAYAAAKSAEWGLTNGVRVELAAQHTHVAALVPALVATESLFEFAKENGIDLPAGSVLDPTELVRLALDGLEAGDVEIMDPASAEAKASLAGPPRAFRL
jgi:short-subunit dehydrogenase